MSKLEITPYGKVTNTYSWQDYEVQFYNGRKQKVRRRIRPKHEMSFKVCGDKDTMMYLERFFEYQKGSLKEFRFDYDGQELLCHFSSKITITQSRELGHIVGFEADISLSVDETNVPFPPSLMTNIPMNFHPYGKLKDTTDWNTNIIDLFKQQQEQTWARPIHTFNVELAGDREGRDKLTKFYLQNGDFNKVYFSDNHKNYLAYMPPVLSIEDVREGNTIIGYTCSFDLIATIDIVDALSVAPHGFIVGIEQHVSVSNLIGFAVTNNRVNAITCKNLKAFSIGELKE